MKRECDLCGKLIPVARLEALPKTHRCVSCAAEAGSDVVVRQRIVSMDRDTYKDLLSATRS